jgi:hypothetical protein
MVSSTLESDGGGALQGILRWGRDYDPERRGRFDDNRLMG